MCRLFGFRSVIHSQVHDSLVHADNALGVQSTDNPDGWGVSYYVGPSPHIIKSEKTALSDNIFKKVSGVVSAQTVLAHIRKATLGSLNILNTHPFQYGNWTFAHNGNVKNFDKVKDKIIEGISPEFRRFVLGTTDSELIFYYILSVLSTDINLHEPHVRIKPVFKALTEAMSQLKEIVGDFNFDEDAPPTDNFITFILTNGEVMVGFNGGKKLYYSTYKNRCSERDTCPSFSKECEAPSTSGYINHLIFSSEPLSGENVWIELEHHELIGVDAKMKIQKDSTKTD